MIKTVLVVGGSAAEREIVIVRALAASSEMGSNVKSAMLIEGLPDGKTELIPGRKTIVSRVALGCICCDNNMIMRVHLNRLIHQQPHQLFLSLSNDSNLEKIKLFLATPSYKKVLELAGEINLNIN